MPLRVTVALGKGKHVDLDLANKNATLQDLKKAFSKKVSLSRVWVLNGMALQVMCLRSDFPFPFLPPLLPPSLPPSLPPHRSVAFLLTDNRSASK
jgi:hypothetical protein